MKIKIKDGKGKRIVTEIKRPDPQAVLILKENEEYEISNEELHTLVECGYVRLNDVTLIGDDRQIKTVYPDSVTYHEPVVAQAKVLAEPVKAEPVKAQPVKAEPKKV